MIIRPPMYSEYDNSMPFNFDLDSDNETFTGVVDAVEAEIRENLNVHNCDSGYPAMPSAVDSL